MPGPSSASGQDGERTQPGDKKEAGVRPGERAERVAEGGLAQPGRTNVECAWWKWRRELEGGIGWHSVMTRRLLKSPFRQKHGERMSGKAVGRESDSGAPSPGQQR